MEWDTAEDKCRSGARFMLQSMTLKTLKAISDSLKITGLDSHVARAKDLTEQTQGPGKLLNANAFTPTRLAKAVQDYRKACGDHSTAAPAGKEREEEDATTANLQLQFEAILLWKKYGVSVQAKVCIYLP